MADRINDICRERGAPLYVANFGSLFKTQFEIEQPFSEVFFAMLRNRGVHVWDHRPCLITLAHTQEDVDQIVEAYQHTIDAMIESELLCGVAERQTESTVTDATPQTVDVPKESTLEDSSPEEAPIPEGAREGKDREGNPGWFVPDAINPGEYVQVS